ncbi:DEAD/DEAH box helicase [Crateriforma spongiae]|uniref:DEAD/DEAH box helicase n=1 Tax=Crateriforma spongiae TaxID=2724528 RepID=UPI0039AF232E
MSSERIMPGISVDYSGDGRSTRSDAMGMRPMQQRVWQFRGEQYLLLKSPPASGKSRALMFVALDKLHRQGLKQAIVVVPEKSIGASFANTQLTPHGFFADWEVKPHWNLCNSPGTDGGKVGSLGKFLESEDQVLVCTHATFRFAFEKFGAEAFDDRLIAVDEFHHVSVSEDNRLGEFVRQLIERDKSHLIAMTGSYFRGDAAAVLMPEDERRFETVTYTYYEQLGGYQHLKKLDIGYFFYSGSYIDDLPKVLDENEKTIIHIPNVNSRESTQDKHKEVEHILETLGEWQGTDEMTGFQLVKTSSGRVLRIADLVDDEPVKREKVAGALRDAAGRDNRDHVDIIIALGMAKEGFDWVWCEHALTIGYRSSLTEIVQIIGRATRDAPGKTRARFTNLIAEPDAGEQAVTEAVNDTLKAIAASLLMEQVLAPRFEFRPKTPTSGPQEGLDYGADGYSDDGCNVGVNGTTGAVQIEINGLAEPESEEATRICQEDLNEVVASFVQDTRTVQDGLFNEELPPQETTQQKMGKIIRDKYPDLSEQDQEAIRQRAIAALNLVQQGGQRAGGGTTGSGTATSNTALIDGIRRYVTDVRDLNVDLIDSINPFGEAYNILAKTMNEERLRQVQSAIAGRRVQLTPEEARDLAKRALKFKQQRGKLPSLTSQDAWERRMAEGIAFLQRMKQENASG